MSGWVLAAAAALLAASLPSWLPRAVVALRARVFAWINGEEGLPVPGPRVPAEDFRKVYAHPAANGRSFGAALSDLFWYWLWPGPEVHQEHLEPGPRYEDVARTTRQILAGLSRDEWAELVARRTRAALDALDGHGVTAVRLRDLTMPVWAEVYYELVFREECPPNVRDMIVGHADDVVSSLKCTRLRHPERRTRLTRYLRERLATSPPPVPLPALLDERERAFYLQGTFFNTAVVQMSEAMAHLLLAVATHPEVGERLADDPDDDGYLDRVVNETLRLYPLFGVAHRIASAEIPARAGALPAGTVLLFNYMDYQSSDPAADQRFDPDRWLPRARERPGRFLPFGEPANRPCPARGFATMTMRVAAREVLRRYRLASAAEHTRSLPSRGPCLLVPRTAGRRRPRLRLAVMRQRDRWESVPRSLTQLVLGTYMVWDARRQRLCQRHFSETT